MTAAATAARRLHQPLSPLLSDSFALIPTITTLLQSLNPQNPQTHQNPDPSVLNQFSPYLNPNLVIEIIKNQPNPYHSLFFFTWASNPNPSYYRHSHFCYVAITDKLLSHKLFSLAADLLKTHNKFSDFMVGKFIKAHGDLGHLKWAAKLFKQLKTETGDCLFSFNTLLGVLVKANKVSLAWGYFGQIVIKSCLVTPDVSTYTTVIKGLCNVGMIEDAEKVFDEMTCGKNSITYNIIIDGFCKKGLVESARRIMDRMVADEGCLPDTVSYTTLIDGYCKKGEFENAILCFDEMVSKGDNCEPNVFTYNVLINGFCLNGDVDEARRMMTRMRFAGVKENLATHTSLLKGYCVAGRSNEAITHFKEMVNLGMNLDKKSYAVIVNEYCKLGRPDDAVVLLREMKARGIRPIVASFNAVFRSYVKFQEFDKTIILLKQMPQWGCSPNFISYSEVIIGLVGVKERMKDIDMIVNDMIRDGLGLDTTLYSFLIQAYCINGDVRRAVCLLKEMVDQSLTIRRDCFEVFVKEMHSRGLMHEVQDLFDQMKNNCPSFDLEEYQSVLDDSNLV
ncbi:hypothetical protein ABFS83_01G009000 [Erythranthe nasuta]